MWTKTTRDQGLNYIPFDQKCSHITTTTLSMLDLAYDYMLKDWYHLCIFIPGDGKQQLREGICTVPCLSR